MRPSIYTAAHGISAQQQRLEVIANNVSNVNTTAFKGSRADFRDALYQAIESPAGGGGNLQRGHGVLMGATKRIDGQGSPMETGNVLDFCIVGNGYFAVQDDMGATRYTRDGSFHVSSENGSDYLVSAGGDYVLDRSGQRITLPGGAGNLIASPNGELHHLDEMGISRSAGWLGVFSFANPRALSADGGNKAAETEASGGAFAIAEADVQVRQFTLEASNVDLSTELTRLIRTQRALSLASKALQTIDEMEGTANRLNT